MQIKEKAKVFAEDHKKQIVAGGIAVATSVVVGGTYLLGYVRGFELGGRVGFHEAIKWFDKTFTDVDLAGLWKEWSEANPDKVV